MSTQTKNKSDPGSTDSSRNDGVSSHEEIVPPDKMLKTASGTTPSKQGKKSDEKNEQYSSSSSANGAEDSKQRDSTTLNPLKRNAFSALMAPKPKQPKTTPATTNTSISSKPPSFRPSFTSSLLLYITQPNTFPPGTIIAETPHTILIRDLYPKALVHLLLIPKDPTFYDLDPFEAFQPTDLKHKAFLDLMRKEAHTASLLAASELSRLVSPYSTSCKARTDALMSPPSPSENSAPLPEARDFTPSIKIGIHASPSMSTLHIHIISEDNYSPHLKTKKHYNSFNTEFFVGLHEFPLNESHVSLTKDGQERLIKGHMKCWRCGRDFGNKFKLLKEHLDEEYRGWRQI